MQLRWHISHPVWHLNYPHSSTSCTVSLLEIKGQVLSISIPPECLAQRGLSAKSCFMSKWITDICISLLPFPDSYLPYLYEAIGLSVVFCRPLRKKKYQSNYDKLSILRYILKIYEILLSGKICILELVKYKILNQFR